MTTRGSVRLVIDLTTRMCCWDIDIVIGYFFLLQSQSEIEILSFLISTDHLLLPPSPPSSVSHSLLADIPLFLSQETDQVQYHPLQQRLLQIFILPASWPHHQQTTEVQISFNTLRLNYTMRPPNRLTPYECWRVPFTRQGKEEDIGYLLLLYPLQATTSH